MMVTPTPSYEVPAEMRDFAEKSVDQARKAFGGFLSAAQKAVDAFEGNASTMQASASDVARKTFDFAEQNVAAAFDLAQKLVRAKDLQEAVQLQAEFARSQMAAMQAQLKEVGSITQSAVSQAAANVRSATTPANQE
jgi:phasin